MIKSDLPIISDSTLTKKLQDAATEYFSNSTDIGLSIGIVKNGEALFLNYGLTKKGGSEIVEHTLFQICSITKTFTGTILADLANQGLLSLDDHLDKYFDFPIANFNNTEIRLVDLATHTSGLRDEHVAGNNMLLEYLKSTKPVTEPGKVYEYSNIGMATLGYIIEKITDKPYEQVVRENICDKIDMKNTVINLTEKQKKMCATPHLIEGNITEMLTLDGMKAAGALISSTHDMVKYIASNLKQIACDKRLQEAIDTAQKIYWISENSTDLKRCLGWWWVDDTHEHGGGMPGYKSWLKLSHNFNAGVIILCNTGYNGGVLAGLASELLYIIK